MAYFLGPQDCDVDGCEQFIGHEGDHTGAKGRVMQIPDEVIDAAALRVSADRATVTLIAEVIAEWARKEALAERDEAVRQLGEVRQAFGDMEARCLQLEAWRQRLGERLSHSALAEVMEAAPGFLEDPLTLLREYGKAVAAEAWDRALEHVWNLNDPAYTVVGPGLGDQPVVTRTDVHQARAENPYRTEARS